MEQLSQLNHGAIHYQEKENIRAAQENIITILHHIEFVVMNRASFILLQTIKNNLLWKKSLSLNQLYLHSTKQNVTKLAHHTAHTICSRRHRNIWLQRAARENIKANAGTRGSKLASECPRTHTCQSGFLCSGKSWKYLCASCRGGSVWSLRLVHERRNEARWTNV